MLASTLAFSQGGTPWTDIDKQKKDYTGNLTTTDRVYKANELAHYPAIEYPSNPQIRGVAYRRGVTVTVVWTIQNNHPFLLQGTLNILGARLKSPGPNTESPPGSGNWSNPDEFRTLAYSPATTTLTLAANGGSQSVTLTFLGVPNYVCLGDLEVKYTMPLVRPSDGAQGENGSAGAYEKFTRLYVVDAQPTGLQSTPWADFLEYTCRWGWGAFGPTDLKEKMTRGMHYSNRSATRRLRYDPFGLYFVEHIQLTDDGGPVNYYLGDLTRSLDVSFWTEMDCRDFTVGLQLALATNGSWAESLYLIRADYEQIITTPLCRAGQDASQGANYDVQTEINFHCFVEAGHTYDAAAAYFWDPYGNLYMDPPTQWIFDPHWQNQVGNVYRGLNSELAPLRLPRGVLVPTYLVP